MAFLERFKDKIAVQQSDGTQISVSTGLVCGVEAGNKPQVLKPSSVPKPRPAKHEHEWGRPPPAAATRVAGAKLVPNEPEPVAPQRATNYRPYTISEYRALSQPPAQKSLSLGWQDTEEKAAARAQRKRAKDYSTGVLAVNRAVLNDEDSEPPESERGRVSRKAPGRSQRSQADRNGGGDVSGTDTQDPGHQGRTNKREQREQRDLSPGSGSDGSESQTRSRSEVSASNRGGRRRPKASPPGSQPPPADLVMAKERILRLKNYSDALRERVRNNSVDVAGSPISAVSAPVGGVGGGHGGMSGDRVLRPVPRADGTSVYEVTHTGAGQTHSGYGPGHLSGGGVRRLSPAHRTYSDVGYPSEYGKEKGKPLKHLPPLATGARARTDIANGDRDLAFRHVPGDNLGDNSPVYNVGAPPHRLGRGPDVILSGRTTNGSVRSAPAAPADRKVGLATMEQPIQKRPGRLMPMSRLEGAPRREKGDWFRDEDEALIDPHSVDALLAANDAGRSEIADIKKSLRLGTLAHY